MANTDNIHAEYKFYYNWYKSMTPEQKLTDKGKTLEKKVRELHAKLRTTANFK